MKKIGSEKVVYAAKEIAKLKEEVMHNVNCVDPWHLVEMGAPEDEYNSQIDRLVSQIVKKKPTKTELVSAVYETFKTNEFELEKEKVKELANRIAYMMRDIKTKK